MQIDVIYIKSFTLEEKKQRMEEGLCLYYDRKGHKVRNYPKKQNRHIMKIKGMFIQENEDAKSQ